MEEEVKKQEALDKLVNVNKMNEDEKTLALVGLKCIVKDTPNNYELGSKIRNIFSFLES